MIRGGWCLYADGGHISLLTLFLNYRSAGSHYSENPGLSRPALFGERLSAPLLWQEQWIYKEKADRSTEKHKINMSGPEKKKSSDGCISFICTRLTSWKSSQLTWKVGLSLWSRVLKKGCIWFALCAETNLSELTPAPLLCNSHLGKQWQEGLKPERNSICWFPFFPPVLIQCTIFLLPGVK